ncbi:MAG TPA: YIP1 family protein [Candidatus Acidoferrum sp.]|jgi:hypothetical protein
MSTTVAMPDPQPIPPPAEIGAVGRITGMISAPKKTFADIARRPTWAAPFLLICALSLIVGVLIGQKTDWRSFFERQMNSNSRLDNTPQEQKDRIMDAQMKWAPKTAFVFALVGAAVSILLIALIYWGAFNLFKGAGLKFSTGLGITSHAFVPSSIGAVLAIVILLLKPRGEVDPEHFLASNVAAFLPDSAPHWLTVLGMSLDIFWIWTLLLIAIGFAAANTKKIKSGSAYSIVFGLWLLWVFCRVAWAAI